MKIKFHLNKGGKKIELLSSFTIIQRNTVSLVWIKKMEIKIFIIELSSNINIASIFPILF